MSPLVHNLYKKIADLEHGIELRELESKMVVRTPRNGEGSASEGASSGNRSNQPRIIAPTVIQPISHHNRVHPTMKAQTSGDFSHLESDNSQMLEKLEGLEFQLACEKRDKLRMQKEIEQMSEKLSQALQIQDHAPAIPVDLQHELSAERNRVDDLRHQLTAAGIQIKDQQRLLDSMTETLTSLQKENDTLRFSVKEMELKLARAAGDDSKARMSDELLATCALMEKRVAEAAAMERQLSEAGRQLEEERGRGSRVARELADARRDVDRVEQALKDQRAKTAEAAAETGHLKQELERQSRRMQEQVAKGQAGEREAEAVRAEFRQFRDKAAAHQTKWRAERHSLMVRREGGTREGVGMASWGHEGTLSWCEADTRTLERVDVRITLVASLNSARTASASRFITQSDLCRRKKMQEEMRHNQSTLMFPCCCCLCQNNALLLPSPSTVALMPHMMQHTSCFCTCHLHSAAASMLLLL